MIELYDDLSQKIPREEVAAFGDIIRDIVKALGIHTRVEIGGGYRRGKLFSSDIDILIEAPDEDFEERNLERIISKLKGLFFSFIFFFFSSFVLNSNSFFKNKNYDSLASSP
eukprot:m.191972 g.191972  ORF g.191972 m.191972 type:complete len:112 (-) comp25728_c0_seq2:679-1014(-)